MTIDRRTLAAYDRGAPTYAARGTAPDAVWSAHLAADTVGAAELCAAGAAAGLDGPVLDLGCGTGLHLGRLGPHVVGVDPSAAMLAQARAAHPTVPLVQAAAGALPFRPGSLSGAWASKCLQHLAAVDLPLALADLHRALPVGAPVRLKVFAGTGVVVSADDLPGRLFTLWKPDDLARLVEGAGFTDIATEVHPVAADRGTDHLHLSATRARTLPDTVAAGMRLLVCGLNPSLHSADAGVPYAGPGNRFWAVLHRAGLLPTGAPKDPWRLLAGGRIGVTDLVKRASPRAAELTRDEYRHGLARLERLCRLLAPEAVVTVGLSGWQAAVDRRARPGWQDRRLGPTPVYVMPSTSGLNCAVSLDTLVEHLRAAAGAAKRPPWWVVGTQDGGGFEARGRRPDLRQGRPVDLVGHLGHVDVEQGAALSGLVGVVLPGQPVDRPGDGVDEDDLVDVVGSVEAQLGPRLVARGDDLDHEGGGRGPDPRRRRAVQGPVGDSEVVDHPEVEDA